MSYRHYIGSHPLLLLLLLSAGLLSSCSEPPAAELTTSGETMGTRYQVIVVAPGSLNLARLQALIDDELQRINALMSTWDPDSEISLFNANADVDWRELSAETIEVIETARGISKETSGAYDITLGSVSALWGFGHGDEVEKKPVLDDVLLLLNDVGWQLLEVAGSRESVRKLNPGLQVDLSSLAKGYAVDKIGERLEASGYQRYLVEIGGEVRTRGKAADGKMWQIGIEWPESAGEPEMTGIAVENAHIASSGDYRNYRLIDGVRYTHILDGRTGYPVSHNLAAVTVLHGSVTRADAWATAFMVLGYAEAIKIANRKGLAARFVLREEDGFSVMTTKAFNAYAMIAD